MEKTLLNTMSLCRPTVESIVLETIECEFESHLGHFNYFQKTLQKISLFVIFYLIEKRKFI